MCPQITQQLSCSLYPARIKQSVPSPKGCMYCGEPPDHTTAWSGYYYEREFIIILSQYETPPPSPLGIEKWCCV